MDKISSIIPGSARVMAVDMKDASPVRPGTPGFGRQDGASGPKEVSQFDAPSRTTGRSPDKAPESAPAESIWKTKESKEAAIAKHMSDSFFGKPLPPAPEKMSQPMMSSESSSRLPATASEGMENFRGKASDLEAFDRDEENEIQTQPSKLVQPEGLYPRGSFIDRTA
jgi:hypothetical protein